MISLERPKHYIKEPKFTGNADLYQFINKKPRPDTSVPKPVFEPKSVPSSPNLKRPSKNPEIRQKQIGFEISKISQKATQTMEHLRLTDQDVSLTSFVQFVKKLELTSSRLDLGFERIFLVSLHEITLHNEENQKTFIEHISQKAQEVSDVKEPGNLITLHAYLQKYLEFVHQKKLEKDQKKKAEEFPLAEKNTKLALYFRDKISQEGLEDKISIRNCLDYIAAQNVYINDIQYRHLLSQMDFLNKSLNMRGGNVKFINQFTFMMRSLPKNSDQNSLLMGLHSYLDSVSDSSSDWEMA
jgi:hypothetical protein